MSTKDELKAKVTELLNSDEFADVVYGDMFNGEDLRNYWNEKNGTVEYLLTVQLDLAGIKEKLVEHHGGEGEGDQYWSVWSFTKGGKTVYVQLDGSYASYDGATYDSWFFVEPEEYVAIRYKKV